jgi:spermidine synthase
MISERHHPLRVYAFLELGIGIIGILVLFGMPLVAEMYTRYLGHGVIVRTIIAAICLLPPTLLMGATLPAIARWVEATPNGVSWMGFFYGGNTAGAVIGCLLAGFYLLRVYDMPTATFAAFAINVTVALFALMLARRTSSRIASTEEATPLDVQAPASAAPYLVIALSGFCALGAEVVWTRLLSLMLGATVYTFSIILAVFLVGLGIGSSLGATMAGTIRRPRIALGACQMALAVAVAWAAFMIARSLPYWPINPTLATGEWGPWFTFQLDILRTAWVILPAAMLWGASFPLALGAVASRNQDPGRMVGGVYAANTVGAILGSLVFSMILVPKVGTQWAQRILMIVSAISALAALAPLFSSAPARKETEEGIPAQPAGSLRGVTLTFASLLIVAFLIGAVAQVPWIAVAWGRFSASWVSSCVPGIVNEKDVPNTGSSGTSRYCTYVGEGMNVSVAVTKSTSGWRYFHGAGKVQASSEPHDMRLQRMLGHLSVLARRNPDDVKDVLVVACGAGVTAGSFIPYPFVKNITICDIEPLVPQVVTPMFGEQNYHVVDGIAQQNPHTVEGKQVAVAYDDGRHYIRTLPADKKYDIITSDPIDPWVKGCAALNTIEYYQMCKEHLKPEGVMSLWIPLYESNTDTAKSVIGTFFKVFPNGILFSNDLNGEGYDAVLLGQAESTRIDLDALESKLNSAAYARVRQSLVDVGFGLQGSNPGMPETGRGIGISLLASYAGRAADLQEWMKDAQINTDRNLRLQYLAGMWLNTYINTEILNGILRYYRFPDQMFAGSNTSITAIKDALAEFNRR